jgi:hypothetical protein
MFLHAVAGVRGNSIGYLGIPQGFPKVNCLAGLTPGSANTNNLTILPPLLLLHLQDVCNRRSRRVRRECRRSRRGGIRGIIVDVDVDVVRVRRLLGVLEIRSFPV